jgi:glucose uptake protein GlcU
MRSTPSFRGIVPASGPQYHQRVGSEERLGMATTIAFSSVGVLSSTRTGFLILRSAAT